MIPTTERRARLTRAAVWIAVLGLALVVGPVLIGRRPQASRVGAAGLPHLITVPSPNQDISRSHVEVRPEGANVTAADLGTTNGTLLRRQGRAPVRMTPNEWQVLLDGDVLDLGDGVTVRFSEAAR